MTGNSKLISLKVEQLAVTRESERSLEKGSMDPELETARSEVGPKLQFLAVNPETY